MKLLIITQKVDKNDDLLGFFHAWIAEFAKNCESVTVVCLYKGEVDLPVNVTVLSLGKEHAVRSTQYKAHSNDIIKNCYVLRVMCYVPLRLKYFLNFYRYIWQERKSYDTVFVHMNSIYVLLGGLFWKMLRKKIGLWYAHGHAPWQLLVAEKMVDIIFTSTVSGCRLDSKKIQIVGQGIDVDYFSFVIPAQAGIQGYKQRCLKLITIGRISPVKDLETLIKAIDVLVKKGINVTLDIIGTIGLADQKAYYDSLQKLIKDKELDNQIKFIGSVPNTKIVKYLQESDVFVSASQTGSLDKTFLEAMACGLPVIGCNVALDAVLGEYKDRLFYQAGDYLELSRKIEGVIDLSEQDFLKMRVDLREVVVKEHGLVGFIEKIIGI